MADDVLSRRQRSFDALASRNRNVADGANGTYVLVSEKPHFSLYHRPGSNKGSEKLRGRAIRRANRAAGRTGWEAQPKHMQ